MGIPSESTFCVVEYRVAARGGGGPGELEKGEQEDDFENKHEVGIDIGNMQRREWWRKTFSRFQRCHQVCIICICSLRHLTIFCQHFWRFCINIFNDSWFAGKLVEGTNCSERALLPEKSMREKLSQLIEDDFSKVTLVNTLKYFKQKSGKNECVDATIKILEHIKKENKVPKLYKTLLREIRKDSPISSWLPSYSQRDTKLLLSFSTISDQSDLQKVAIEKQNANQQMCRFWHDFNNLT